MRALALLTCLLPLILAACGSSGGTVLGTAPAGVGSPVRDLERFPPGTQVMITGKMVEK